MVRLDPVGRDPEPFHPWVAGLTVQTTGKRLRAVGRVLGMPKLCPSCFRDYVSSTLRHADIDFPVRPVDKEHREKWMGHHEIEDINDGDGRFRPDFLIDPRVATEAFLRDLDRRFGGALFRQGPDKTPLRALYPPRRKDRARSHIGQRRQGVTRRSHRFPTTTTTPTRAVMGLKLTHYQLDGLFSFRFD